MRKLPYILSFMFLAAHVNAQHFFKQTSKANAWVDSVYASLTPDQRLAQLMVIRESGLDEGKAAIYTEEVSGLIKKYNVGAICLFQGSPDLQAVALQRLQEEAKTPLMVCIDGESGLGMRMESVQKFPDQLTMGAMRHADKLVYDIGKAMAQQCQRMGIQVNYAPVVDINNNPDNPVIGYRSYGQDKHTVASYGIAIMKGMQDQGILACAKHFPGHGDVAVDSHLDLPVIQKPLAALDTLELYPFKKIFKAGIGSVMIAHLSIPKIDSTPHLASSLSPKFVTDLLRKKIGFKGLSFTDALEMKGVAKYFPQGEVAVLSLIAGNDMLCLPGDIPSSLQKINAALADGRLGWTDLEQRIKKVLYVKYHMGLSHVPQMDTTHLTEDLNSKVAYYNQQVAKRSLTAVRLEGGVYAPLDAKDKIAFIQVGSLKTEQLGQELMDKYHARGFYLGFDDDKKIADGILAEVKAGQFNRLVIILSQYSKQPAQNFHISATAVKLISDLQNAQQNAFLMVMGNPYAIGNFTQFKNLIAAYQDGPAFQQAAFDFLSGKAGSAGRLPVTVAPGLPYGTGLIVNARR